MSLLAISEIHDLRVFPKCIAKLNQGYMHHKPVNRAENRLLSREIYIISMFHQSYVCL